MLSSDHGSGTTLADRITGGFPLSISTSLALESLFISRTAPYDTTRPIPQHIELAKYQDMWFNVCTLFRNLTASIDRMVLIGATPTDLADIIELEIEVINSLFLNEGSGLITPKYYTISYERLYKGLVSSNVLLRLDKTDQQRITKAKLIETLAVLRKRMQYYEFTDSIKPQTKTNSLILTHVPYDLLSYKSFTKLDLLESNTGKLKPRTQWNSKYNSVGTTQPNQLPFNRLLLFVFGDRVLIRPTDIRFRRLILQIAETRHWNQTTTMEKILLDISLDIRDPYLLEFIKHL